MNNKRQTIWLVSMLSLMVVLSAYYLFTEDVNPTQNVSQTQEQVESDGTAKTSGSETDGITVTEVDSSASPQESQDAVSGEEQKATDETDKSSVEEETTANNADQTDGQQKDEAVLKKMGSDYFNKLQLDRKEKFSKLSEQYDAVIADTKNHSQEEASTAAEQLTRLEDLDLRLTSLEEKLLADYDNAVVTEEDNNFKVVVEAEKLEKKQAVSIVTMAQKELSVTPDRVTVQYVAPQ